MLQEFQGSLCFVIPPSSYHLFTHPLLKQCTSRELFTHWRYVDQLQMSEQMYSSLENNYLLRSWSWEHQESLCLAILSTKLLSVCSFATEVLQAASTVCEKNNTIFTVLPVGQPWSSRSTHFGSESSIVWDSPPVRHQVAGCSARDQWL